MNTISAGSTLVLPPGGDWTLLDTIVFHFGTHKVLLLSQKVLTEGVETSVRLLETKINDVLFTN